MSPDDNQITPTNQPAATPQPSSSTPPVDQSTSQAAAANVVRNQIENIYSNPDQQQPVSQTLQDINPYERTHDDNPQPVLEQWKQYHSAWQTYYQKYYEGYYTHHLTKAAQQLQTQMPVSTTREAIFTHQPDAEDQGATLTKDEALFDLRQKLLSRVSESAKKVRKSRHFVPITAAILVILLFAFLQYNRVLIGTVMAYVSPGSISPQDIVVDPNSDVAVAPDPRLIIPKINVDVPVLYDVGNDYNSQMAAMAKGVAQFAIPGASSHPGQIGNTVLAGHSSNDLLDSGDYKFIFAQLDKLDVGDSIYVNYHSIRYTYTVTKKEVVKPTEVNKLVYPTTKPILTLLTCTPVGTALNRLLVTAEQVSPDPAASAPAPTTTADKATTEIPGNSPTLFERLFGG
jgi:sortase A